MFHEKWCIQFMCFCERKKGDVMLKSIGSNLTLNVIYKGEKKYFERFLPITQGCEMNA
jgi:hypothetical protein